MQKYQILFAVGTFGSSRAGSARFGPARPGPQLVSRLGSVRVGSARPGSARLGLALPVHKVGVLRRRNSTVANKVSFRVDETTSPPNHCQTRFQSQEKNCISRRRDATLFCVWISARLRSARLSWAGLGWARLRVCLRKWVFRVDETAICQKK